jgi:hypothetical protein
MKYAAEMILGSMVFIPRSMKISIGVETLLGGIHTQTER